MRHKGVRWHHVESDILKEGPGTETSWEVRDLKQQIPSIKVLFKTNAKSRKHPGIKLLSSESKAQLYIYIYINTELLDGNKGHQEETHHFFFVKESRDIANGQLCVAPEIFGYCYVLMPPTYIMFGVLFCECT